VAKLADLGAVAVIEVLAGAENFDQRDAGVPDTVEPDGGEAVSDEEMSGERVKHPVLMIAQWVGLEEVVVRRGSPALKHAAENR